MSLITDLLSKVTQTKPRKDVPPGLTNSINTFKKRETNRKRAILFSVVVIAALVAGFATVYAAKLLLGSGAGEVRLDSARPVAEAPAMPEVPAVEEAEAPATQAQAPRTAQAKKPAAAKRPAPAEKQASTAPAAPKPAGPSGEPGNSEALRHYYTALDFEREGNLTKAIGQYTRALAIEPRNFRLMNKVGGLYMQMKMWKEAGGYLEDSVAENGRYVPALINMGTVYAELGRFEEAERSLKEALSLEPSNSLALFNIALLYEKQEMPEKARENYMKLKQFGEKQGVAGIERLDRNSPAK